MQTAQKSATQQSPLREALPPAPASNSNIKQECLLFIVIRLQSIANCGLNVQFLDVAVRFTYNIVLMLDFKLKFKLQHFY